MRCSRIGAAGPQRFRQFRQRLCGGLALFERSYLLFDRRLCLGGGSRLLLGRSRDLLGAASRLRGGTLGFGHRGKRILAARSDLGRFAAQLVEPADHRQPRFCLRGGALGRASSCLDDCAHFVLDCLGTAADLSRAFLRGLGQRAHLFGHDGETAPMVAGSRRLDRRVQGQEVGLVGDFADRPAYLADILGTAVQFGDQRQRGLLPIGVSLNRLDRNRHLRRGVAKD